tara:strand:- start:141 stop:1805 length:1665 start_codon:yes stop_codon:yes gene_type:complete
MENLKQAKFRLGLSGIVLFFIFSVVGYSVFQTANNKTHIKPNYNKNAYKKNTFKAKERGKILDRDGYILATTIQTEDLILNPSIFNNPQVVVNTLNKHLYEDTSKNTIAKIKQNQKYLKLKKNISQSQYLKVLNLGIPGIALEKSYIRKYPGKTLASHILGKVDADGKGVSGIELYKENKLSKGENINLSINAGIQNILRDIISLQIEKFQASGGAGILMDANNGEIYAIVSLPDFDNNEVNNLNKNQKFNKATKGIYELGSTLKIFTAAIALESGLIKVDDLIDVSKPIRVNSSKSIKDHRPLNFAINLPEVIVHSSNIGSAHIARLIGHKIQHDYLNNLGFNKKIPLELIELGKPKINSDKRLLSTMTKSFGYGIQITPTHLTAGTAAVLNNGYLIKPTLLLKRKKIIHGNKIFSDHTSKILRSIMHLVVNNKNGTGKLANAPGYFVGGKTGTAYKINDGKYSDTKKIVAFTGAFPINKPKFAFTIMIDNPKPQKFSSGYATGGWVAAPIIKKFINRIAPILKIYPISKHEIDKFVNLKNYKIRGAGYKSGI